MTDAGTLLHPHAKRILSDVDEAETLLGNLAAAPRGTLRVNAPFSFAVGLLAPMLPEFLRLYPAVRVVLDINNRWISAGADEADVVIRVGDLADSSMVARRLATVELWLCASPDYLSIHGILAAVADLGSHELIS
jgi:LysR family transcriptional activator of dmlA